MAQNQQPPKGTDQRNEGEGNRTAAKQFDDAQTKFAQSGKVQPAADKAKQALNNPREAEELRKAEAEGRKPAERQQKPAKH